MLEDYKLTIMKELSIEEKAKAYDEALARANELYNRGYTSITGEIFPELEESDDEKVRKELIKHLKELSDWKEDEVIPVKNPSYYRQWASWLEKQGQVKESFISQHEIKTCKENNNSLTSEGEKMMKEIIELVMRPTWKTEKEFYRRNELCAWIKKQGEHANFLSKIQVGDKVTRNEAGVLVNLSQLKRVAKPSEKQCGQKFEMKTAEESLGIDSATYNKIVDECIFGEQKPEENKGNIEGISPKWSVEDEENFCSVYLDVKSARQNTVNSLSGELKEQEQKRMDEVISWLSSLKGRVLPKQEWNEEDEQHIDSLLKRLDALCRNKFERTRFAISEDRDWLKSINPQNHWKPSDEQISLLQAIINDPNNASSESCQIVLKDILEQLKKLNEGEV